MNRESGLDRIVHGTDYGHLDLGSDPDGLHVMSTRPDVDAGTARKIVDANARRMLAIDPGFSPAPAQTMTRLPDERISLGLPTPIGTRAAAGAR